MAVTAFATGDNSTSKVWARKLEREVLPATLVGKLMGTGPDAAVQVRDDLQKNAGDRIRFTLSELLSGNGVSGNEPLEGSEVSPSFRTQDINIDQHRQASRWYGRIDKQRVAFDVREDAKIKLRDWWADILDRGFINQLCGNTVEADTNLTGLNAVTAHDSGHIIYGNDATSVATLGSNDTFSLDLLDEAQDLIEMFKERGTGYQIRPFKGGYYGVVLSPAQVYDMRTSTTAGQWQDIQLAAMKGGEVSNNPIFTGALGVYNRFILFKDSRVPKCIDSGAFVDNTRCGAVFGAQAVFAAFGRETPGKERFLWNEETFDYGNEHGVSASLIYGMERAYFNSKSYASIALMTYTTTN